MNIFKDYLYIYIIDFFYELGWYLGICDNPMSLYTKKRFIKLMKKKFGKKHIYLKDTLDHIGNPFLVYNGHNTDMKKFVNDDLYAKERDNYLKGD